MDVVGTLASILSCLGAQNCLNESVGQQCGHLRRPKRKLDKLRTKMEELNALAVDVKRRLELMQMQHGMEPGASVKLWLNNAEKIESKVSSLINKDSQVGLDRCYPNYFCSRIKFGEGIEEKIKEVAELIEKGQFSDDSLAEKLLKRGYALPVTRLVGNMTTMESLNKIWGYLMDHKVERIGVYGMGGIGKTTLMTEINNRILEESSRFDCVIWITAPKESNLEKLQNDIAKQVNLDLSFCEDKMQRRAELLEVLKRRKRFVLILDDLWEAFPLEEVGIPVPTLQNGCKLVITTRSLGICQGMETDREVEVKVLSENEAYDLFIDKVGEQMLLFSDRQKIARDVVKECGGLPLAIITVGRALRKATDISEWENALTELRSSTATTERMQVFASLRYSFEKLKDDTSRSCFLCCALYPKGHQIDAYELIEYWMWEGLLGDVGRIQAKKQKGKIILNELKNACLLESVTEHGIEYPEHGIEYVRMHGLIRDMAISISTSPQCIIKAGIGLRYAPSSDEWTEDVQRISLMINHVKTIPFNPRCPRLTSLLLQYNSFCDDIPYSFFDYMPGLKVLNLSYTGIKFLPSSLSNLQNLCTLVLTNCWNLETVPSLAKLVKLRVLNLSYSHKVSEIPHGMEHLGNLRCLNLSYTSIDMFPAGSLVVFTLLEEFSLVGVNFSWGSKSVGSNSVRPIQGGPNIEEVISSTYLAMLEVNFWELEVFDFYVKSRHWEQLEKYKLVVGNVTEEFHGNRSVIIGHYPLIGSLRGSSFLLPTNSWELHLEFCSSIRRLSMCLSNLVQLKTCTIRGCAHIESIVKSGENNLSTIKRMKLSSLKNLRMICEDVAEPLTLSSLKIIEVADCGNLKCLFLGGLLQQLQNLEEIIISECTQMEDIMLDDRGTDNASIVNFPNLKKLKLYNLPELKSIYNGVIVCDSLLSVEVWSCNGLKRLPLALGVDLVQQQLSPPPALKEIKGTIHWWESLEWDNPDAKTILQPYFQYENMPSDDSANAVLESQKRKKYSPALEGISSCSKKTETLLGQDAGVTMDAIKTVVSQQKRSSSQAIVAEEPTLAPNPKVIPVVIATPPIIVAPEGPALRTISATSTKFKHIARKNASPSIPEDIDNSPQSEEDTSPNKDDQVAGLPDNNVQESFIPEVPHVQSPIKDKGAASSTQKETPAISQPHIVDEDPEEDELDFFMSKLEADISKSRISHDQVSSAQVETSSSVKPTRQEIQDAIKTLKKIFVMDPTDAGHLGRSTAVDKAFNILTQLTEFDGITAEQKAALERSSKSFQPTTIRASQAAEEKKAASSLFSKNVILKTILQQNVKDFKALKLEFGEKRIESKAVQQQVKELLERQELLNLRIKELQQEREKIAKVCEEMKAGVEAFEKDRATHEARFKAAEVEENEVLREWKALGEAVLGLSSLFE